MLCQCLGFIFIWRTGWWEGQWRMFLEWVYRTTSIPGSQRWQNSHRSLPSSSNPWSQFLQTSRKTGWHILQSQNGRNGDLLATGDPILSENGFWMLPASLPQQGPLYYQPKQGTIEEKSLKLTIDFPPNGSNLMIPAQWWFRETRIWGNISKVGGWLPSRSLT